VWLLTLWHLDSISKPDLFNKTAINLTFEFNDFRRYDTSVESYQTKEPKKDPER